MHCALQRKSRVARRKADAAKRRLDHEISGHLPNVGAPLKLLRLVFEKIAAGESVAIGFDIAPTRIARDWRIAPAELPSGLLGAQPPVFEPHGEGIRIEGIERRDTIHDDQPMNIELELHQQFIAKTAATPYVGVQANRGPVSSVPLDSAYNAKMHKICSPLECARLRRDTKEEDMGRAILLWLLGIPIRVLIFLALLWH